MLDWLGSKPSADPDDSSHDEPPETPAHLFAVKAFKSAFFGTPAPTERVLSDDEDERYPVTKTGAARSVSVPARKLAVPSDRNISASPTKGILLTPGTMGTRRKTVSFERLSGQKETEAKEARTSADDDQGGGASQAKDEVVRRTLFTKGAKTNTRNIRASAGAAKQLETASKVTEVPSTVDEADDSGAEATLDLEHPKSYSGRHWMRAYQREHEMSKQEMKKLIRWSQGAKERADRRDRESFRVRDKLVKTEERVKELEGQVLKLSKDAKLHNSNVNQNLSDRDDSGQDAQLARLQKAAKDAEDKASKLERENDNFKKTILRVKDEMAKYEKRHKEWVERHKRKDERHAEQRKELKDKILLQKKQYAEQLRQVERDAAKEKAQLLRDIDFLRGEVTSASPAKYELPAKTASKTDKDKDKGKDRQATSQKVGTKSKTQETRQLEPAFGRSSPTILDNHLERARGPTPRSSLISLNGSPVAADKISTPSKAPFAPETDSDEEAVGLPQISGPSNQNVRPVVRVRKGIRVKSRQAPGIRPNTTLPPDREAAARMRIAQKSAEKQRDTRFLFGKEKENRLPLLERLANL